MIPQQMETAYQCQLLIFPKDDLIKMVMVFEIKNQSILKLKMQCHLQNEFILPLFNYKTTS